jgi:hypothetical protein
MGLTGIVAPRVSKGTGGESRSCEINNLNPRLQRSRCLSVFSKVFNSRNRLRRRIPIKQIFQFLDARRAFHSFVHFVRERSHYFQQLEFTP